MKESVKKLLSIGTKLSVSLKHKINEHYGNIELYRLYDEEMECFEYIVCPSYIKFIDADEAVNYFCYNAYTSKNYGYVQQRLYNKGLVNDNTDFEKPNKKLKELFIEEGKLVDKEAIEMGFSERKPFPTEDEAKKELRKIFKGYNIDTISDELKKFKNKYYTMNVYVSMNFIYDSVFNGKPHDYKIGLTIKQFTRERLEKGINEKGSKEFLKMVLLEDRELKFKHILLDFVFIDGSKDRISYIMNDINTVNELVKEKN